MLAGLNGLEWDSAVCHKGTIRVRSGFFAGVLLIGVAAFGQPPAGPDWRRIGSPSVELMLASPATGPVESVWFAPDGRRLYARTRSGHTFQTDDFDTWSPATAPTAPPPAVPAGAARLPETGARVLATADPARIYALASQLSRSDDGGRSWTNLTAFKSESVIGGGQNALAVSPADPDQIVVANDFGVWRSLDGGLSWSGLNQSLPNLPVRRLLGTPTGTSGARVWVQGLGALELPHGAVTWVPQPDAGQAAEANAGSQYSAATGAEITSFGTAGDVVYAGASDGRIWVSFDAGRTFRLSRPDLGGPVERVYVDPVDSRVALAALGGTGARVLRTTNAGSFWDDLTSNLPEGEVRAVTAERAAGAVYVASDAGVFYARADLNNPGSPNVNWTLLTGNLPRAAATDVKLDPAGNQLYIALDGYGVYAALAPHRATVMRVVNAADFSTRAAAPGSLLSVIGGRVDAVSGAGLSYPVLAASDSDSQVQVPFEAAAGNVALALQTRAGSLTVPLPLLPVSPAIFVGRDGAPMVLDGDSGLLLDGRNPARSNMRVQIFATGLGKVRPDWPTGLAAPLDNAPAVVASVTAFLDRAPVEVTRATLAPGYIGFYLVEVQLPAVVNAGQAELYIAAGGQESNRVQITIEP